MLRHSSARVKLRNSRMSGPGAFLAMSVLAAMAVGIRAESPLSLKEAMRSVLQHSEEAQLMSEKETRLDAQKSEALSGALPNVQLYANAGRGSSPFDPNAFFPDTTGRTPPVINFAQNRFSYGVQVNQPIYSFGRVGQAYHIASVLQRSQVQGNQRSRQQLELQTLDSFYGLAVALARREVIQTSLKRQGETVALMQSNFKMGAGQRSAVLLATASLKGLEPQRIRAESEADAAGMALNRLLGRPIQSPLELDTALMAESGIPSVDTSESGIQNSLNRRSDLSSLALQKDALKGYAKIYRMQYLPSLGFQGKWGILAYHLNNQLHDFDKDFDWQVGVGLQWTIFDGFGQSSKAREYDSDARSLDLSERQARAFARIEIEGALREADAAETGCEASKQALDAADDALQMITGDFRSGKGQITELLSAEEGLRNAELGLLSARYQKIRARAALRVALGMDLIEEGSK